MATQTTSLAYAKSVRIFDLAPGYSDVQTDNYDLRYWSSGGYTEYLILGFNQMPAALRRNRLLSVQINAYVKNNSGYSQALGLVKTAPDSFSDFTPSATNWNNTPEDSLWNGCGGFSITGSDWRQVDLIGDSRSQDKKKATARAMTTRPIKLGLESGRFYFSVSTPPTLTVEYDDSIVIQSRIRASGKMAGYVNPHQPQTFAWYFEDYDFTGYQCAGDPEQTSATFYWRVHGDSTWTTVAIQSATQSITIPAETFPLGSIDWKVSGTDNGGCQSETPVYVLTTQASAVNGYAIAPNGSFVDDTAPVTFSWATYSEQTAAQLQISRDGSTWSELGSVTGSVQTLEVPASEFEAGQYFWRFRAANVDDSWGPYCAQVTFYFVQAPAAPVVDATSVPFTTITWQASGQQAYEVQIDGKSLGTNFGTAAELEPDEYLPDGLHTIAVRVQNTLGLWSPFGTATINVVNVPGSAITLTGEFGIDAHLTWTGMAADQTALIYRDGKRIGRTAGAAFTDRFVLGEHDYYIIVRLAGGYYTQSNEIAGELETEETVIDTLDHPSGWIRLRLSENAVDEQIYSFSRTGSLRHYTGAEYPVVEISTYSDMSGNFNTAFTDMAAAKRFESLRGKVVIVKSRGGNVVVGAILQLDKRQTKFYAAFSFTVNQIAWEDYVDDQNG